MASLVAQTVKHLPTMRETRVRSHGKIPWRRKWHPTPALFPGKSHGPRSLVGYSPWGCKESDTTESLHFHFSDWLWAVCASLKRALSKDPEEAAAPWRGKTICGQGLSPFNWLLLVWEYVATQRIASTLLLTWWYCFIVYMEMVKMWMLGIQPFQVWELVILKNYNKDTSMYSLYVLLMSVLSAYSVCGLQFSCSVMSDALWPRGLQHARLPCPSPTHVCWAGDPVQPSYPLLFPSLSSLLLWAWTEQTFCQHVTSVTNLLV